MAARHPRLCMWRRGVRRTWLAILQSASLRLKCGRLTATADAANKQQSRSAIKAEQRDFDHHSARIPISAKSRCPMIRDVVVNRRLDRDRWSYAALHTRRAAPLEPILLDRQLATASSSCSASSARDDFAGRHGAAPHPCRPAASARHLYSSTACWRTSTMRGQVVLARPCLPVAEALRTRGPVRLSPEPSPVAYGRSTGAALRQNPRAVPGPGRFSTCRLETRKRRRG